MRFSLGASVGLLVIGTAVGKTVLRYDRGGGEPCGYDHDKTVLHKCAGGFICNDDRICSTMVIMGDTVGARCGTWGPGGAVTYICHDPLVCVDEQCVERDEEQGLLYKQEDIPPPRKRDRGIVKRVWNMFRG